MDFRFLAELSASEIVVHRRNWSRSALLLFFSVTQPESVAAAVVVVSACFKNNTWNLNLQAMKAAEIDIKSQFSVTQK